MLALDVVARSVLDENRYVTLGTGIAAAAEAYNERSLAKGGQEIGVHEVRPTGRFRVYRATVTDHWVLDPLRRPAGRLPVTP